MIPETTLYLLAAVAFGGAAAGFGTAHAVGFGPGWREAALVVGVCTLCAAAYALMWQGLGVVVAPSGEPVALPRFVEYAVTMPLLVGYVCVLASASRRVTLAAVLTTVAVVAGAAGAQLLPGSAGPASFLAGVGALFGLGWLLVGPARRAAADISADRRLLAAKLRTHLLFLWTVFFVFGVFTRSALGVLDAFTGVVLATYLDLLVRVGFGLLVFRAGSATLSATRPVVADG